MPSGKLGPWPNGRGLSRLVPTERLDGVWAVRDGRRLLSFSCNDYLNLSHHPDVKAAAVAAHSAMGEVVIEINDAPIHIAS